MSTLLADSDIAYLQSLYPFAGIERMTAQQERFVLYHMRGMSVAAAERAAGYSSGSGQQLMQRENIQIAMQYLREQQFREIRVTRDTLTAMLFDAHSHAANTIEEVSAIRELGKMHGLYESDKQKGTTVQITNNVTNVKQLERLSDGELLKLTGDVITLEPSEYERVG